MSTWVLVIVFGWPSSSAGVTSVAIDMPNQKSCKAAAMEVLPRATVRDALCIEKKK